VKLLEECISNIRSWILSNELMINDSKTEFMIVGTRQQLAKLTTDFITVGREKVERVAKVRNLGIIMDQHMTMDTHIGHICSSAFHGLYKIRQLRSHLNIDTTKTLVHAFVTSKLDYCNSLMYGVPKYQKARLQRVLNAAARLVVGLSKYDHITPTLISLHWLPIPERIDFKILLLVYKSLHKKSPEYIYEMLDLKSSSSRYSFRSQNDMTLNVPRTKCRTLGDRAFSYAGPYLWNKLPKDVQSAQNIESFKKKLKTFMFQRAYDLK
jgi:hypothetical protein